MYAAKKDSSTYFYAGNTTDIKNVYHHIECRICGFGIARMIGVMYLHPIINRW